MNKQEIVNLIVAKFGGNRVKFDYVGLEVVDFVLGHNLYRCSWVKPGCGIVVSRLSDDEFNEYVFDNYSRWVEGILNGMVRNDAGEMVPR